MVEREDIFTGSTAVGVEVGEGLLLDGLEAEGVDLVW